MVTKQIAPTSQDLEAGCSPQREQSIEIAPAETRHGAVVGAAVFNGSRGVLEGRRSTVVGRRSTSHHEDSCVASAWSTSEDNSLQGFTY